MKKFVYSYRELKSVKTLALSGILIAMAIIMEYFTIKITPDIWISFSYLPIAVIGYLFGPTVCGLAYLATDFLGYIIGGGSPRAYHPLLALVIVLSGIIFGLFLYKKEIKLKNCIFSKAVINIFCFMILNSFIIFTSFYMKDFNVFSTESWMAFFVWIPQRIIKNIAMLPLEIFLMFTVLKIAEKQGFKKHNLHKKRS